MPTDAKLVWVTREERDGIVAVCDLLPPLLVQAARMPSPAALMRAFDAAPVPVERRRCVTHGEEQATWGDGALMQPVGCWRAFRYETHPCNCRFVTVFEVPAPEADS